MPQPRYDAASNSYVFGNDPNADRVYTTNGFIAKTSGVHAIAKTSAATMVLDPPTAAEEGTRLIIVARTAFPHTVTIAAGIGGRGGSFDVLTFAAVGDSIELLADNLQWVPVGAPFGVVFS
jgi:hypothetical protein